jgi:hypothetical protein
MASPASDQYYLEAAAAAAPSPSDCQWIEPITIDDDDLTFGGKPLSTLYEEERQRLSSGSSSDEEERRGRQRVRNSHLPNPRSEVMLCRSCRASKLAVLPDADS